ncbi:BRO family protein [Acetobacter malorum]|uniref:BRO-N domain-containing protein n=1 Tax=Acetobacter malorum TaxID=178901 RepID=UPI000776E6B1|nr:BRO family protein [Acetobacter malorum]
MTRKRKLTTSPLVADTEYAEAPQFRFNDTTLQTFVKDGEVWFRMIEVCEAIAHSSPAVAARGLDDDEKRTVALPSSSGIQNQIVVNESGLYHFLIKSQLPLAVAFRRWITKEVLPSIRRNGFYARPGVLEPYPEDQTGDQNDLMRVREMLRPPGRYMVLSLPGRPLHVEIRDLEEVMVEFDQADVQALVSSAQLVGSLWRNFRTEDIFLNKAVTENSCGQQLDQAISLSARLAQWVSLAAIKAQKEPDRPAALTK